MRTSQTKENSRIEKLVDGELPEDVEQELKDHGHPTHLESVDGSLKLNQKEIKKGILFFDEYSKDPSNIDELDGACKKGCYLALNKRCDLNVAIIKDDKLHEDDKTDAKRMLLHDIATLSNLYWSVGCLDACQFLFQIGDYYYDKFMLTGEDAYWQNVVAYWTEAATYYLHAKTLYEYQNSVDLNQKLYDGKRLTISGFDDPKKADEAILGMFDDDYRRELETKEIEWQHQIKRRMNA